MAPPATLKRISPVYKYYFLYFEPFMALVGTVIIPLDPKRFLEGTVPGKVLSVYPLATTPVVTLLLTNIASLYLLIAFLEGVGLRLSREKNAWYAILGGLVLSDIGHIYAVYTVAPERALAFASWNFDEWFNYGTLLGGFILRLFFFAGIGRA